MPQKKIKQASLNESLQQLDEIVAWLEEDGFDLEEGLKRYEQGVQLVQAIQKRLQEMSVKVEQIQRGLDED